MGTANESSPEALDWAQMRGLSSAPRLSDLCQEPPQHLFDFYYQVGETQYVFAAPHWNEDYTEHAIYVGGFYWAPSFATFRRMVVREIDAIKNDDGITCLLPEGLKLAPECDNFESISRFASSDPRLRWRVLDLFAGKDWTATGSSFAIERLTYHFRSPQPVPPTEVPYGVALSVRDDLWEVTVKV